MAYSYGYVDWPAEGQDALVCRATLCFLDVPGDTGADLRLLLHFLRAYTIGDSSMDIDLPTWPAKLVVPFALTVLALRLILQMWGYIRAIKEGSDEPIGVPMIESAADVAAKEAESLLGDTDNNKRGA